MPTEQTVKGLGSGFIFDDKGYIMTNNHVIAGATKISVLLADGSKYPGKLVGTDEFNDIAIVKIDSKGKKLPVAPLGSSKGLESGQLAIAIGNPLDVELKNTVTMGVISAAKGRHLDFTDEETGEPFTLDNVIQTDAAINPGNSGGPLLDSSGKVIGINTAIRSDGQGIGFAVPINTAKEITPDLIKFGKIKRPTIGAYGFDLTKRLAEYNDLPISQGAVVERTSSGGPADSLGIQQYDIIVEMDGKRLPGGTM
jgi:S1-C subfamily serine protease